MNESAQDQLLDKIQLELESVWKNAVLLGGSIERWRQDIPEVHLSFVRRIPGRREFGKKLMAYLNLETQTIELSLDYWDDDLEPGYRHWHHQERDRIPFDFDRNFLHQRLEAALQVLTGWTHTDLDRRDQLPT